MGRNALIIIGLFLSSCGPKVDYECTLYAKRVSHGYEQRMGQHIEKTVTDFVCIRYELKKTDGSKKT